MQTLRIIKTIDSTNLQELMPYIGKKVEITILPFEDLEIKKRKKRAFEIIERCAGHIQSWTRDEIHER